MEKDEEKKEMTKYSANTRIGFWNEILTMEDVTFINHLYTSII